MNNQEVFDKVAEHLYKQGSPSMLVEGSSLCAYRGSEGRMCAVGCLIPDDIYHESMDGNKNGVYNPKSMEGTSITSIIGRYPELAKLFKGYDIQFLAALQVVHDTVQHTDGGKFIQQALYIDLRNLAVSNSLNLDKLEALKVQYE